MEAERNEEDTISECDNICNNICECDTFSSAKTCECNNMDNNDFNSFYQC
jgi:hypothetical protein